MKLKKEEIFCDEDMLDKKFVAYGRFYNIQYSNSLEECRNILEIYRREWDKKLVGEDQFDAIFIMMNPGASKPINDKYKIKSFTPLDVENEKHLIIPLELTQPDKTQYQIMRIMEFKKWNFVKVINLSDIREAKSNIFYNKLNQLQQIDIDYIHSVFSIKRIKELNKIFTSSKEIKVIVAWGVNSKLRFLINKAISNSNLKNRIGYAKNTYKKIVDFYYYHPLQRGIKKQKKWLINILSKI